jgi:hypothetical protein
VLEAKKMAYTASYFISGFLDLPGYLVEIFNSPEVIPNNLRLSARSSDGYGDISELKDTNGILSIDYIANDNTFGAFTITIPKIEFADPKYNIEALDINGTYTRNADNTVDIRLTSPFIGTNKVYDPSRFSILRSNGAISGFTPSGRSNLAYEVYVVGPVPTATAPTVPKSSPDAPMEQAPPAPNPITQPVPAPTPIETAPTPVTPVDPTPSEPTVPIVVIPPYTPVVTPTVPTNTNKTTVVESNSTQVVKANPVPTTNTSVDSSVAKPRAMFDSAPTTNRCVGTIQKPLQSPCPVSV